MGLAQKSSEDVTLHQQCALMSSSSDAVPMLSGDDINTISHHFTSEKNDYF
jgi:hypothetical protein